jgi:hypothetical protein
VVTEPESLLKMILMGCPKTGLAESGTRAAKAVKGRFLLDNSCTKAIWALEASLANYWG